MAGLVEKLITSSGWTKVTGFASADAYKCIRRIARGGLRRYRYSEIERVSRRSAGASSIRQASKGQNKSCLLYVEEVPFSAATD